MLKKITLLLIISSLVVCGFAQKPKRKSIAKAPKNGYFEMTINGCTTQNETYCPYSEITFNSEPLDTNIKIIKYCWYNQYHSINLCDSSDITPITLSFPIIEPEPNITTFSVELYIEFETSTDTTPVLDTLTLSSIVKIDYFRTTLDTTVCQGRDITITTNTHGDTTFYNVQSKELYTLWDTLKSVSECGCDSLVRWHIIINPYVKNDDPPYTISSCDSVIWYVDNHRDPVDTVIIKRPDGHEGDYDYTIERVFYSNSLEPCCDCDTIIRLTVTIIDTAQLKIIFKQEAFCAGDDMGGNLELETNFTAFDWTYLDKDSSFTVLEKSIEIEYPGYYFVLAYMDTSLYDTLNIRIVCCSCSDTASQRVDDCPLIIPNIITPNDDKMNDVFGIKKLNPVRENELTISDRWGKTVFHQKNYQCIYKNNGFLNDENAFKGLSRDGRKLPDGTYYYAFKYASIPKGQTYTGVLTILRD
ncbi:MAG: gliding motility-associated C-terminal domain-containing protein [Lentimicrobiaceae bacterium]|nr:gliding motility-associated C-terminal domain-containing protein [Lentimicrobiaceae bacterium]